jgi:ArsR family transcriptional regulator
MPARAIRPSEGESGRSAAHDQAWIARQHANFCSVFADEKRLRIMWFLRDGEHRVSEIAEHLGVTAQNASQHLRVMRNRGALVCRREGQFAYYRIANRKFMEGAQLIRQGLLEELKRMGRRAEEGS